MLSFGDKLKRERESRNRTLEDLSGTTGIGLSYLEALEHNKFEALPGRAFGKLYIRAYADVLGFDPKPLIADYERERLDRERMLPPEAWNANPILVPPAEVAEAARKETAEVTEQPSIETSHEEPVEGYEEEEPEVEVTPPSLVEAETRSAIEVGEQAPREAPSVVAADAPATEPVTAVRAKPVLPTPELAGRIFPAAAAAIILVAVITAIYFVFFRGDASQPDPDVAAASMHTETTETTSGSQDATPVPTPEPKKPSAALEDQRTASPVENASAASTAVGALTVSEFGVGRDRRLANRDDRFEEGEVVWFSTRVLGGRRGVPIRHVWLRDGKTMQSIELPLGSASWRTQSYKTLWGTGAWTVEARDAEGRVLAAAEFTCVPRSR